MIDPGSERHWTPRAALSRFVEVAREGDARSLWFKIWGELCYRRLGLFELGPDSPVPPVAARIPITVAPLAEGQVDEYAALSPYADPAGMVAPRLSGGHRCFLAQSEGELVGSCWVARRSLWSAYLRTRIDLAADEACTYETHTAPHMRGKGIGSAMRADVARLLREEGVRRLLATVDPENAPAIRMIDKLGYRRIGTIGYIGIGSRRKQFCRMRAGESPPGASGHS
jgi:GNAT superfamily N-acetyltransferase